jgi:alpha-amylase/alpha-mannosidase (GH57 family)
MAPVRFVFGVHVHQPVGNFDHVFAQHVEEVYLPFLTALTERDVFPIALHVSGPLLEWLAGHDARYLDLIAPLADSGKVELLLAGFYEPILAALPRRDRVEQLGWMREWLRSRFGVEARSAWLTERVWEPELAADLAEAGVESVLVDDRHFLVSGFERDRLHAPYRTESDGRTVAVMPIDERLRYLVPFRPPAETAAYFRYLAEHGHALAVFADDGEKFGGWPGTREWVYDRGWLAQFLDMLLDLRGRDEIALATPSEAVRTVPSAGLAYLPTASYREMEAWALWPAAAARMKQLEHELGEERLAGPDGALIRGAHWRNFLVKYPESARMHKKMVRLSALCRERGDPPSARRALGRAQCNDAYWHGVFGGLYLPHLRAAIWRELAEAEAFLRRGEPLAHAVSDVDADGHEEIALHSDRFAAVVSPRRGGVLEELTVFAGGVNLVDVLTRRWEAYHQVAAPVEVHGQAESEPETGIRLTALPPRDHDTRALFLDRVLDGDVSQTFFALGNYLPIASWVAAPFGWEIVRAPDGVSVTLRPFSPHGLERKTFRFAPDGHVTVEYRWAPEAFPRDAWFTTELSVSRPVHVTGDPDPVRWTYPITTVAKSERGLEETVQGTAILLRWPAGAGQATVTLDPAAP